VHIFKTFDEPREGLDLITYMTKSLWEVNA